MDFEAPTELSFRDLSAIQAQFSDLYMREQPSILGVRIRRDATPPVLDVKYSYGTDSGNLGLPDSFEGVAVQTRPGSPAVVAV